MAKHPSSGLTSHSKIKISSIGATREDIPFAGPFFNRKRIEHVFDADTCTDETFANDVDINYLVNKHLNQLQDLDASVFDKALYGVDGSVENFTDMVTKLDNAKSVFQSLPAAIRSQFDNDVLNFAHFVSSSSDEDLNKFLVSNKLIKDELSPTVGGSTSPVTPQPMEPPVQGSEVVKKDVSAS